MRIGVVTESSTAVKNKDVVAALDGFGYEIKNVGMKGIENEPVLNYIETAAIGALLLDLDISDFIIGGCGTGQGFFNAILQFPGITCGLIQDPSDAWLYAQINGGNSISLALNKGYGWAGDVNLKFIFEKLFSVEFGSGYPDLRRKIQQQTREALFSLSKKSHKSLKMIFEEMEDSNIRNILTFPGVWDLITSTPRKNSEMMNFLEVTYNNL